jgi:hypothetical protein
VVAHPCRLGVRTAVVPLHRGDPQGIWQSANALFTSTWETPERWHRATYSGIFRESDYSLRAYVINLVRSTDRRQHIEAELRRAGLGYEFVAAVDGRLLDLSGPRLVRPDDLGQWCSPLWVKTWDLPGAGLASGRGSDAKRGWICDHT